MHCYFAIWLVRTVNVSPSPIIDIFSTPTTMVTSRLQTNQQIAYLRLKPIGYTTKITKQENNIVNTFNVKIHTTSLHTVSVSTSSFEY